MQLVTRILPSQIVTNLSAVRQPKRRTSLLTNGQTIRGRRKTITRAELGRAGERFDCPAELLGRDQVQVDDVVSVLLVRLRARRGLGD